MPKVSVVIPNYNHAPYLRRRIESVLEQTWDDLEVLLLDDCSTDGSREIIESFRPDPRVRILCNQANSGSPFKQWNKGVRHATGEYVWIAESDDLAEPQLLERVVGAMEEHGCGVGCCESWLLHGEGEPGESNLEPHFRPPPRRDLWTRDFVSDGPDICIHDMLSGNAMPNASAVVFRRDLYERVGGADERMRQVGDRMMWIRMLGVSRLAHVGDRLNYFRFHGGSVRAKRGSSARTIGEVYSAIRLARDTLPVPPDVLEQALATTGAYFAQASVKRGVSLPEMVRVCREASDVDPDVWQNLFRPWVRHRTLGRPVDLLRRAKHRLRAVGGKR